MCGIAALFEPGGPPWLAETLAAMTRAIRHRGPDGEGLLFFSPRERRAVPVSTPETPGGVAAERAAPAGAVFGLGHRRLAILDLSAAGHQPMADETGGVWLVFNGEIYNYVELRRELEAAGHRFRSGTDTEVILAAWREWGEGCLARFNGMFAFVLHDLARDRIFAARDRFGEKPLYFWRTPDGGIALGSEIKQFTVHPGWRARLNGQRAYDFLNWGLCDHTAETFFAGVEQIRGGEFILASLAELPRARPQRWYEIHATPFAGDFAAAAARFRELLDDSVRLRLRADVAVGSCLSGGLDSSSIVCTLHAQLGGRAAAQQKTFSACSDVARFDERPFIDEVTRATGVAGHQVIPSPARLQHELDRVVWHQDEPFVSTSIYAQWCVFRLARETGVGVMLDGQGADEALAGYHGYFAPHVAGAIRRGKIFDAMREAAAIRRLHGISRTHLAKEVADLLLPAAVADRLRTWSGHANAAPDFLRLDRLGAEPRPSLRRPSDAREPLRSLGIAQLATLTLPMLLRFEDRDSMAHGVEARLPFLDHRLVEFSLGLPEAFKLANGWTKRVLREAMQGRLPAAVRQRRDKLGFVTAEEQWMRETHRADFLRLLDAALAAGEAFFTPAARTRALRIINREAPFNLFVWRLISFGAWLRCFHVT